MLKKILATLFVFAIIASLNGCAVNRATASLTPGSDLSQIKSFYVISEPDDKNGVNKIIQEELTKRGYSATVGPEKSGGYDADALVSYKDKWMWDITMYMIELTITVRNPKNNFPLATGNSFHTSLTRKSPPEMVEEVLDNIFKSAKEGK